MATIERYGLLALFVLCMLIIGVGVFGGDGDAKSKWENPAEPPPESQPALRSSSGGRESASHQASNLERDTGPQRNGPQRNGPQRNGSQRTGPQGREHEGLQREPSPGRNRSFPNDRELWSAPKTLDGTKERDSKLAQHDAGAGPDGAPREIKVRDGDTFESIAIRELGSRRHMDALIAANPGTNPRALQIGQVLKLPAAGGAARPLTHRVRKGDTLQEISKRHYGTVRFASLIAEANGMRDDDLLKIDSELRIPPDPRKSTKN